MVRTRFAPSPTGYMHIGNLRTALYAFLFARSNNGKFILRIEDTDIDRTIEGAVEVIYRTLNEAGLSYDEGPNIGGNYGPYIQTARKEIYQQYAHKLVETGSAYYCFCSKERLETMRTNGALKYDKHCLNNIPLQIARKKIAAGEPYVIRQNIPLEGESTYTDNVFGEICVNYSDLEDNILLKSDGMPTYNFANVVDDHLMQITHVIRGIEYLTSTTKYNLIYDAFGWERPQYIHLQPIMRDATHKLSKRTGDASFEDFLAKGYLSQAIINYIALLGWNPKDNREKMTLDELISLFSIEGLSKSPSIFDEKKLRWLNAQYIKELPETDFFALAKTYYDKLELAGKIDYHKLSKLLQPRLEVFSDIDSVAAFLNEYGNFDLNLFENKKQKSSVDFAREILPKILIKLSEISVFENANLFKILSEFSAELGIKSASLFWVMRIALTGVLITPGGATEMAELFGKETTLNRMKRVIERLK